MKNESEFFSALETAQVEALLDGPNTFKFTVFAPSNAAFARLKAGDHRNVFEPANLRKLRAIMSFHMVSGQFSKAAFKDGQEVMTSHGTNNLKIVRRGNRVWISGGTPAPVELRTSEINCDNGVIHVIDEVLLPLAWHKAPAASPRP